MPVLAAFAVPHPPLIIPAVGRGRERGIQATIDAYDEVGRRVAALAQGGGGPVRAAGPRLARGVRARGAAYRAGRCRSRGAERAARGARGLLLPDLDGVDTVDEQLRVAAQKGHIDLDFDDCRLERFEAVRHV